MGRPRMPLRDRLTRLTVKTSSCWLYAGGKDKDGYGVVRIRGGSASARRPALKAHRVAYELAYGPIPAGLHIRHACHVRHCINPAHLSVGTNADNVGDMMRAGRQSKGAAKAAAMAGVTARGEAHSFAKLTAADVRRLRERRAKGATYYELGREFGIAYQTAFRVAKGQSWKHVT